MNNIHVTRPSTIPRTEDFEEGLALSTQGKDVILEY